MNVIKKEIRTPNFTEKKYMLLGIRKEDNGKVWMEQASFDCDWYYGFGYLEVVNHLWTDINEHYHFNGFFEKFGLDKFNEDFKSCVLNEHDIWILFDLMKTFYTLKETAELYYIGSSHYTQSTLNFKNEEKYKEVLKEQEKVIKEVQRLLGLSEEQNIILEE